MKHFILIVLFVFALFVNSSLGCSRAGKRISAFDQTEYIFIGQIVGFTKAVKSKKLQGSAYGLIVKVKESIYLPQTPKTHFEIFPIELWADCSLGGTNIGELKKNFPVNSEIRVIAKEAEILLKNSPDSNIRLEERPGEVGSIALNYDEKRNRMTSSDSVFDYKSFKYDYDTDTTSKYLLPNFEIRKDLLRLRNTSSQEQRNTILNRLFYAPTFSGLSFYDLFEKHSANKAEAARYYEDHLKFIDPKFFEQQYKPFTTALEELIKLGYPRNKAEETLGKALEEGTEISSKALIKRSLELLAKEKSASKEQKK